MAKGDEDEPCVVKTPGVAYPPLSCPEDETPMDEGEYEISSAAVALSVPIQA